jgi:uncharacterized membrane protein
VSNAALAVAITTFLASMVEAIEMVAIVTGVGATRGWRASLAGAAGGLVLLAMLVAIFGLALTAIPIDVLRLVVGVLLLIVGLNWLRKGIRRVAVQGLRGTRVGAPAHLDEEEVPPGQRDWTGFVLSFKGVLLEGLEVAFIVVTFGSTSNQLPIAIAAGVGALVLTGVIGVAIHPVLRRIPRSALQLVVGLLLTTFGTFWAVEGAGVEWPASDLALLGLLALYVVVSAGYLAIERSGWRLGSEARLMAD